MHVFLIRRWNKERFFLNSPTSVNNASITVRPGRNNFRGEHEYERKKNEIYFKSVLITGCTTHFTVAKVNKLPYLIANMGRIFNLYVYTRKTKINDPIVIVWRRSRFVRMSTNLSHCGQILRVLWSLLQVFLYEFPRLTQNSQSFICLEHCHSKGCIGFVETHLGDYRSGTFLAFSKFS